MVLNAFVEEVALDHPSSRSFWRGCVHAADVLLKVQAAKTWRNTKMYQVQILLPLMYTLKNVTEAEKVV